MFLIFDTSILIEIERGNKSIIEKIEKMKEIYPSLPKISFISYYEFLFGIRNRNPVNKEKAERLVNLFEILQTSKVTARQLVELKSRYEFPFPDLLIAAQVIENKGILVTKDKDFEKIKEIDKIIL